MSYDEGTLKDRPPLDVIKMRLIKRKGTPGKFFYISIVRAKLGEMFPGLDTKRLTV